MQSGIGEQLEPASVSARLPRHVGIIMDGNGRWARARGLSRAEGHERGAEAVRRTVRACRELGVPALTLFAFSAQNWQRPPDEVVHLMQLLRRYLIEERGEITDNAIRLIAIGDIDRLPAFVREPLASLIADSAEHRGMTLCLALSYGGREAIVEAARTLARECVEGSLTPSDIDAATFSSRLPTSIGLPPLDLLIRTSGERRVSNFFLWELAYAELHFCEAHWPDFSREELTVALEEYARRERRFGRTSDQLRGDLESAVTQTLEGDGDVVTLRGVAVEHGGERGRRP